MPMATVLSQVLTGCEELASRTRYLSASGDAARCALSHCCNIFRSLRYFFAWRCSQKSVSAPSVVQEAAPAVTPF